MKRRKGKKKADKNEEMWKNKRQREKEILPKYIMAYIWVANDKFSETDKADIVKWVLQIYCSMASLQTWTYSDTC